MLFFVFVSFIVTTFLPGFIWQTNTYLFFSHSFCVSLGVTSHQFALWESFYTPSDAALTLGGGVPP